MSLNIQEVISSIAEKYDTHQFISGGCHNLAAALYLANGQQGKLIACLRRETEEDGSTFSTTYSHMVYEDEAGSMWDIGGNEADSRWESLWEFNQPDEDGMFHAFDWIEIDYNNLQQWVSSHRSLYNEPLIQEMAGMMQVKNSLRI